MFGLFLLFFVTCEALTVPQNCIDNRNQSLNCIIETGGAEAQCPKKNVIRIIGDYQNISIHCSSDETVLFNYAGIKPTEGIRVNSWRDVALGNTTNGNPNISRQHIKVEVLSVVSLIEEYKKTMKIESLNPSIAPYYSRSGWFRFMSGSVVHYTLNFSIFFEEPKVDPGFINMYEHNQGWKALPKGQYFVPCQSTHYVQPDNWGEPELWVRGDKIMPDKVEYVPSTGFYVNSSVTEILNMTSDPPPVHCIIPHKTNRSKNITFDPNLTLSACKLSLENSLCGKLKPNYTDSFWSFYQRQGKFIARCTEDSTATLYFIAARNPEEQILVRDFVLPNFVSRSLYVEKGAPNNVRSEFGSWVETRRGTPLHFGAVYCNVGTKHNLRSFVTDIKGGTSFKGLSHSIDWRNINNDDRDRSWPDDKLPSKSDPTLYLELNNAYKGKTVYDCDNLTFQCRIHPFFERPVVWEIERNGNITRQVEKDVTVEPSILKTQLKPGFVIIKCNASLWAWATSWRSLSVNVTVQESTVPRFVNQQIIYEFASDTKEPQVKVIADGLPLPNINCIAVPPGKDGSGVGQNPVPIPEFSSSKTNVSESAFKLKNLQEVFLICEAKNARGVANVTIKILVKYPTDHIITISVSSSIASLLVLILLSVIIRYCIRRRRSYLRRMAIYKLIQNVGDSDSDEEGFLEEEEFPHLHPFDYDYEIDLNSFTFDESKCLAKTPVKHIYPGLFNTKAIAVKTTLKNAERSCTHALLTEYKIQIYLGYHPNLVQLIGGCTSYETHGRVFILEEFCEIGILRDFLRCNLGSFDPELGKTGTVPRRPHQKNARLSTQNLFDWSIQIVGAMEYLSEKGIIHRDLCTKNILMNSIHTVKIGGLEYARRLYAYPEYSDPRVGSTLSWRWMAVESIRDRIFSVKSDVWSMGVTLWEIFNYAEVPYGNKAKNMVMVYQLENGLRLEKPKCATELMHQKLLLHCWNANPDCRPNFAIIKELLKTFVKIPASSSRPGSFTNRMSSLLARV